MKIVTFSVSFFSPASVGPLLDLSSPASAVTDVSPEAARVEVSSDEVLSVSAADDDGLSSSDDDGLSAEASPAGL